MPSAETTESTTNQNRRNHDRNDKRNVKQVVWTTSEWGLWILSPSRSNGAAKHYSILDGRRVPRHKDGRPVHTRWSVRWIRLFFWKLSLFPAERLWGTVLYESGKTGLRVWSRSAFITSLTLKNESIRCDFILYFMSVSHDLFYVAWFMVGFFRLAAAHWTVPARPTGRAPELCMAPPWGAKQAHRSSAPAWSPGKTRAGITVALHCGWQRFSVMQCGTLAQSLLSERFPGLSTADNGGAGTPWSSGPHWHEVTRILALILNGVLQISGVWNVKVDGFNVIIVK